MKKFLLAILGLTLGVNTYAFPYKVNTAHVPQSAVGSLWTNFIWSMNGGSDQSFILHTDAQGISKVFLRLGTTAGSTSYPLEWQSLHTQLTPTGTIFQGYLNRTSLPPDRTYYAEFAGYLGTNTSGAGESLGRGRINIQSSLFTDENYTTQIVYQLTGPETPETDPVYLADKPDLEQSIQDASANWSTNPAVSDVDLSSSNINNAAGITFVSGQTPEEYKLSVNNVGGLEYGVGGGAVTLQVGEEVLAYVRNGETFGLVDGDVVYYSGVQGDVSEVKLASASIDYHADHIAGIVTEPISSGGTGRITAFGSVNNLDIDPYTTYVPGTILYLSTVAGKATNVVPDKPNSKVILGHIVRNNSSGGGDIIHVQIVTHKHLYGLDDVKIVSPSAGQILEYDGTVWSNKANVSSAQAAQIADLQGYTNRAANALNSNVWAFADSTTNYVKKTEYSVQTNATASRIGALEPYTSRVVAVEGYTNRAAKALDSNVWAVADSTTNYASRVSFNTLTQRVSVLEPYTARVVAVEGYTNRAANAVQRTGDNLNAKITFNETSAIFNSPSYSVGFVHRDGTATPRENELRSEPSGFVRRADGTSYKIWDANIDGSGSGLDADLLDGNDSTYFVSAAAYQAATNGIAGRIAFVEAYTNRAAGALQSNVWASADSTTNYALRSVYVVATNAIAGRIALIEPYTSRVVLVEGYTNRAAGALQSNAWLLADSTTNYAVRTVFVNATNSISSRIGDAESRLSLVEPYTSRVVLAENRIVLIEPYTSRVVLVEGYTNRAALALDSNVWAISDSTTNYQTRTGFILSSNSLNQRISLLETTAASTQTVAGLEFNLGLKLDSNTWALADSTTNYQTRTGFVLASNDINARLVDLEGGSASTASVAALESQVALKLDSNHWASADSTTNYVLRTAYVIYTNGVETRFGNAEGRITDVEAYTSRVAGAEADIALIEPYTSRVVLVEGYTNRAANALNSNVWAVADSTTNYQTRTGFVSASNDLNSRITSLEGSVVVGALSSSVWASADSTTNYASRVDFGSFSNSANARLTGVEAYTNRAALALSSSVWASADSTTNYQSRVEFISATNSIASNISALQQYTNRSAGALQSNIWADADSTTNYASRINFNSFSNYIGSRVSDVEGYTNRAALALNYNVWSVAPSTTNYASRIDFVASSNDFNARIDAIPAKVRGMQYGSFTNDVTLDFDSARLLGLQSWKLNFVGKDEGLISRTSSFYYFPYGGIDYLYYDRGFGTERVFLSNDTISASFMTPVLDPYYVDQGEFDAASNKANTAYTWGDHSIAGYAKQGDYLDTSNKAALAYSWGDHSLENYISAGNETDPVFNASVAKNITAVRTGNWTTAYNWGDHSLAGYANNAQFVNVSGRVYALENTYQQTNFVNRTGDTMSGALTNKTGISVGFVASGTYNSTSNLYVSGAGSYNGVYQRSGTATFTDTIGTWDTGTITFAKWIKAGGTEVIAVAREDAFTPTAGCTNSLSDISTLTWAIFPNSTGISNPFDNPVYVGGNPLNEYDSNGYLINFISVGYNAGDNYTPAYPMKNQGSIGESEYNYMNNRPLEWYDVSQQLCSSILVTVVPTNSTYQKLAISPSSITYNSLIQPIGSPTTAVRMDNSEVKIAVDGINEYEFGATSADFNGNTLNNVVLPGYATGTPLYVETEPAFNASVAKNITATHTGNWTTAYNWGNHATANYVANNNGFATSLVAVGRLIVSNNAAAGKLSIGINNILHGDNGTLIMDFLNRTLKDDGGIWKSEGAASSGEEIVNYQTMTNAIAQISQVTNAVTYGSTLFGGYVMTNDMYFTYPSPSVATTHVDSGGMTVRYTVPPSGPTLYTEYARDYIFGHNGYYLEFGKSSGVSAYNILVGNWKVDDVNLAAGASVYNQMPVNYRYMTNYVALYAPVGAGDNLGNHIATNSLNMNNNAITNASLIISEGGGFSSTDLTLRTADAPLAGVVGTLTLKGGSGQSGGDVKIQGDVGSVYIESLGNSGPDGIFISTFDQGGGNSGTWISNKFYIAETATAGFEGVNYSTATNLIATLGGGGADDLGNHQATQNVNMAEYDITNVVAISGKNVVAAYASTALWDDGQTPGLTEHGTVYFYPAGSNEGYPAYESDWTSPFYGKLYLYYSSSYGGMVISDQGIGAYPSAMYWAGGQTALGTNPIDDYRGANQGLNIGSEDAAVDLAAVSVPLEFPVKADGKKIAAPYHTLSKTTEVGTASSEIMVMDMTRNNLNLNGGYYMFEQSGNVTNIAFYYTSVDDVATAFVSIYPNSGSFDWDAYTGISTMEWSSGTAPTIVPGKYNNFMFNLFQDKVNAVSLGTAP